MAASFNERKSGIMNWRKSIFSFVPRSIRPNRSGRLAITKHLVALPVWMRPEDQRRFDVTATNAIFQLPPIDRESTWRPMDIRWINQTHQSWNEEQNSPFKSPTTAQIFQMFFKKRKEIKFWECNWIGWDRSFSTNYSDSFYADWPTDR